MKRRTFQSASRLLLAAELPEGSSLRVAVCEAPKSFMYGEPVPADGFGFDDFDPVFREDGKISLRWKTPSSALEGRRLALYFETEGGTLCSLLSEEA